MTKTKKSIKKSKKKLFVAKFNPNQLIALVAGLVLIGTIYVLLTHAATSSTVKPVITGLMDRGMDDPSQPYVAPSTTYWGGALTGYSVNVGWNEVQPTPYGSIQTNTRLHRILATVQNWNSAHPFAQMHIRLRIFAGVNTPAWAMNLDGPAMTLRCDNVPVPFSCFTPGAHTVQIPRFWGPNYTAAYDQMMTKMSAQYDRDPEISEVVASQCSTLYPETFLRQFGLPGNAASYVFAGWTQQADQACMQSQINIFTTTWPTTNVGLALNPYDTLNTSTMQVQQNENFTDSMMAYCRQTLGRRCVLENYSTRSYDMGQQYDQMYNSMIFNGPPLAYETAIDSRVTNLNTTLCADIANRWASDIELPRGYNNPNEFYNVYRTPTQLMPYNNALISGLRSTNGLVCY